MNQPYCDLGDSNYFEEKDSCFDKSYNKLVGNEIYSNERRCKR
jgi:hypothetical protein